MKSSFPAKVSFVLSIAILSFFYGYVARWHEWFPNSFLERASKQASQTRIASHFSPNFLNPRVYDREGVRGVIPEAFHPGVTLVTSLWQTSGEWQMGAKLLGKNGEPVHEWKIDATELFPNSVHLRRHRYLHGSHLYPDGDFVVNVEYQGTVRVNPCGEVRWTLAEPTHHSLEQADDGTFWIPGHSQQPKAKSNNYPDGFPGLEEPVWLDQILHVSADGSLLSRVNVLDILYENGLERYIAKAHQPQGGQRGPTSQDITHMNDIEPLSASMADEYPLFEAGDLLVSLRNLHLVFVYDPESKEVKWHTSRSLILQHDPDFIGNGWIGVFDNARDFTRRGTMAGGSRIVVFQPHTGSMETRFPTPHSDPFYTHAGGKWQALPNGNMLLTEARPGRIVEVASDGRTVWEWIRAPYNESQVATVLEGTRYDLSPADIQSWTCSSTK